jgi:hypothetical protein
MEVIVGSEAQWWRSVNLRNALIAQYDAMARSPCQLIFEVAAFKKMHENIHGTTLSNEKLAEVWATHVTDSGSDLQEKVSFHFIDTGIKVHDRLLSKPETFKIIQEMETTYGKASCLSSTNMEAICMKGSADDHLWTLNHIQHSLLVGDSTNKDFTQRSLSGGRGGGNRGQLDAFLAKKNMMQHFVDVYLPARHCPERTLVLLRGLCSHQQWRLRCSGTKGSSVDISWQGKLHEYERKAVAFLQVRV